MLKRTLLLISLLVISLSAQSQYYSTTIDVEDLSNSGWQVLLDGEELVILSGAVCGYNPIQGCAAFVRTDLYGGVLSYSISQDYVPPHYTMFKKDNGEFMVLLQPSPLGDTNVVIQELGVNFSVVQEVKYGGDIDGERAFRMTPYKNGYVAANLIEEQGEEDVMWIQYLNWDLQQTHEVFFPRFSGEYGPVCSDNLISTADDHLIGTANGGPIGVQTGLITKFDSLGQVIWQTVMQPPVFLQGPGRVNVHVTELHNGNLVINWEIWEDTDIEISSNKLVVYGLSGETGDTLWSSPFNVPVPSYPYIRGLHTASNGDIIGFGYISNVPGYMTGIDIGWMFRMSPQGQLKWQRAIHDLRSPLNMLSVFYDVAELPNGDLVFVGSYQDTFPNQDPFVNNPNIWLVRTDSAGCLTPDCGDVQVVMDSGIISSVWEELLPEREQLPFQVFPNPATEAWNVEWPYNTNAQLVLYNMQGQALRQEALQPGTNRVSALNLPPGMYVMQVRSREGWGSRKVLRR
jgi:hypothetical protein